MNVGDVIWGTRYYCEERRRDEVEEGRKGRRKFTFSLISWWSCYEERRSPNLCGEFKSSRVCRKIRFIPLWPRPKHFFLLNPSSYPHQNWYSNPLPRSRINLFLRFSTSTQKKSLLLATFFLIWLKWDLWGEYYRYLSICPDVCLFPCHLWHDLIRTSNIKCDIIDIDSDVLCSVGSATGWIFGKIWHMVCSAVNLYLRSYELIWLKFWGLHGVHCSDLSP